MTSAMLRAGRVPVPAKITSSISEPRICLAEVSPITHFSASTRFDLPQPLGPTMPVMPDSIASSVGSTKDLKPESRSLSNWTIYTTPVLLTVTWRAWRTPRRVPRPSARP